MTDNSLSERLRRVRWRLFLIGSAAAVAWTLAAAIVMLLAAAWLDLLWEPSPGWRIGMLATAGVAALGLLVALTVATVRTAADRAVAGRLDRAAGSGGQVLSGLDLSRGDANQPAEISVDLARMAVGRAERVAAGVPMARAVPIRPLGRSWGTFGLLLGASLLLVFFLWDVARTEWSRFTDPFGDVPPFSQIKFEVTPGDAKVIYGEPLDVRAKVTGGTVERLELVLQSDVGGVETLPMFPESGGSWRASLAKVTEPGRYHVRSYRARSKGYRLDVTTVPRIEEVLFWITPPRYAHAKQGPYKGPMPSGGVAGLPGTKVRIRARSNRPLSGGTISIVTEAGTAELRMNPTADAHEAEGTFEITADGKFALKVIDTAEPQPQPSQQTFTGSITLLADERPFIRLEKPEKNSLATPTAALPVIVDAEDDCGVSKVELYRSLNDSRPMATEIRLAKSPGRRVREQLYLPLQQYGLQPGDVIKLFARVEDNDPAGAKGSESAVVTVQIISQEEFERMVQVREGLDVMMSKYREARRRMEGLAKEADGLRKKLKDLPPESPVAEQTRQELKRLVKRLRKESDALKKLAQNKLPYDIDKNLTPQLEQAASMTDAMAKELEKLLEQENLLNEQLEKKLDEMNAQLAGERSEFDQQAMQPLEHLELVFPLLVDQSRFTVLVMRQKDLAERLASLRGRDGEDNPVLKARMRELEQEQAQIRGALTDLLDDIDDHVEQLPEKPEFEKLRETATQFVDAVRFSGATERMIAAEAGLAEFSGTIGYDEAKEAADILEKFLKQCEGAEGMGNCAGNCLIFQPGLSKGLGNSIAQILAQMGMTPGSGAGMGSGYGMGGNSAQRGGMGLYGGLPGMAGNYGEGREQDGSQDNAPSRFNAGGSNPQRPAMVDAAAEGRSGGGGGGHDAVPARYLPRVDEYRRRISEEVENR
ncbi:MAG: hypothetical protein HQ567_10745 [Candidatus Nealsonbacteria bacterium]|nr:hypothetical protein [Candidatus Nealsonbacteria bacterium]